MKRKFCFVDVPTVQMNPTSWNNSMGAMRIVRRKRKFNCDATETLNGSSLETISLISDETMEPTPWIMIDWFISYIWHFSILRIGCLIPPIVVHYQVMQVLREPQCFGSWGEVENPRSTTREGGRPRDFLAQLLLTLGIERWPRASIIMGHGTPLFMQSDHLHSRCNEPQFHCFPVIAPSYLLFSIRMLNSNICNESYDVELKVPWYERRPEDKCWMQIYIIHHCRQNGTSRFDRTASRWVTCLGWASVCRE